MIAILLVALFAVATLGSVWVLADSAVRGRNAFRQLRGVLAGAEGPRRTSVRFEDFVRLPALPALRQRGFTAGRQARPKAASPARTLPAAA